MDGRHRVAVHARVLPGGAGPARALAACCASGRTPTTSAPRTCGPSSAPSRRSSPTARCGWSATATCCWSAATEPMSARGRRHCRKSGPPRPRRSPTSRWSGARDPFSLVSLLVAEGHGLARFAGRRPGPDRRLRPGGVHRGPRTVFSRKRRRQHRRPPRHGRRAAGADRRGGASGCRGRSWRDRGLDAPRRQRAAGRPGPTSRRPCAATPATRGPSRGSSGPAHRPTANLRRWRSCANWQRRPTTSRRRALRPLASD